METKFRKIWYVPLEEYVERYTHQLSKADTGWTERFWKENGIPYERVNGSRMLGKEHITSGVALDAAGRGFYACSQIMRLLLLLDSGKITSEDIIYFEDFWHPGIEALPYYFHLTGVRPKMYAVCWAQSVDKYDFTHGMKQWIHWYERGNMQILDGVFVTSTLLKQLLTRDLGVYEHKEHKIHVVGHPFMSKEIKERCPTRFVDAEDRVVFSSRWDWEKRPRIFLELAKRMPQYKFVVCTSAPKLRSNMPQLLKDFGHALIDCDNLELKEGLTKDEYYTILATSKVQFNCALQDWVSFAFLEAVTCGCIPIYPYYRSFVELFNGCDIAGWTYALQHDSIMIEEQWLVLERLINTAMHTHSPNTIKGIQDAVLPRFDKSFERMIHVFNGEDYEPLYNNNPEI